LKVLVLHNFYQRRGGEDVVVAAEHALMRDSGRYDVHVETVTNDAISGIGTQLKTFLNAPYDRSRAQWARELLGRIKPDVVHIHNFFPLLTPAVHHAAAATGVAVVQTLHNYRLICGGSSMLRNGTVCEKCVHGTRLWAVVHRCYRGSLPASVAAVRMQYEAQARGTWRNSVHRFIALSQFGRRKFIEGGLPGESIVVKPNFAIAPKAGMSSAADRSGVLYVGRLSAEKGVNVLLAAASRLPDVHFKVAGDGPQRARLQAAAPANVEFLDWLPHERIAELMREAACVAMPSMSYEGCPMVAVEAFANGAPVVASRLGALGEMVTPENGVHFEAGDAEGLAGAVGDLLNSPQRIAELSAGAMRTHQALYTPEANIRQIGEIYQAAIEEAASRRQARAV
jgi:glycosyltransferase involved in cell wall biosynthesis